MEDKKVCDNACLCRSEWYFRLLLGMRLSLRGDLWQVLLFIFLLGVGAAPEGIYARPVFSDISTSNEITVAPWVLPFCFC